MKANHHVSNSILIILKTICKKQPVDDLTVEGYKGRGKGIGKETELLTNQLKFESNMHHAFCTTSEACIHTSIAQTSNTFHD